MAAAATQASRASDDVKKLSTVMLDKNSNLDGIIPKFKTKDEEREYLKHRLAQAFRIFGYMGFDEGVAGHITMRDPIDPHTFWVNPFGRHFSSLRSQDLLHVDHSGKILEDSGPERFLNKAAFMIHSEIHKARPDVNCAAHSHTIYGRAFAALGIELDMLTQDSCAFYKDHVVYKEFHGVVLDEEEGVAISKALGTKKAAILQNHGLLVATDTIEATVHFFSTLEHCCQVQLLADAAAAGRGIKPVSIPDHDALNTWRSVGDIKGAFYSGLPHFQALERRELLFSPDLRLDATKFWSKARL
ncbi:class II aldolase/adducin domain-containing protein [Auriculariales sp. MPI-PUGE-AT-0066]|nr:class II aldolase/adducin domain-containing protein [Auriculariales sp. MPI-PUGE-AT-0066]